MRPPVWPDLGSTRGFEKHSVLVHGWDVGVGAGVDVGGAPVVTVKDDGAPVEL